MILSAFNSPLRPYMFSLYWSSWKFLNACSLHHMYRKGKFARSFSPDLKFRNVTHVIIFPDQRIDLPMRIFQVSKSFRFSIALGLVSSYGTSTSLQMLIINFGMPFNSRPNIGLMGCRVVRSNQDICWLPYLFSLRDNFRGF